MGRLLQGYKTNEVNLALRQKVHCRCFVCLGHEAWPRGYSFYGNSGLVAYERSTRTEDRSLCCRGRFGQDYRGGGIGCR